MKSEKVIAYVGANSDHPHAADIVTALLGNAYIRPDWLTKPEPKRSYRVLLTSNLIGETMFAIARDRNEELEWQNLPSFVKWVSPWMEYETINEPQKRLNKIYKNMVENLPVTEWPSDLVARIAKIDIKAAEWLRDNWEDLDTDKYKINDTYGKHKNTLCGLMYWDLTPQKQNYWQNISNQLGE